VIIPACIAALLIGFITPAQLPSTSHLRSQHSEIIKGWLSHRSDLRLATEADCVNKNGLAAMRKEKGRNYQPYYAVGDFNLDGEEDFAVALINSKKRKWKFAVAVFNGPLAALRAPSFLDEQSDLSDGGFWVGSVAKGNRLIAGTFESDNCIILQPRRKSYVWKNCVL
jgi:hypothetical protein